MEGRDLMLTDITMGQYYPVDSFVHRLDPRTKVLLTIAYIIIVFLAKTFVGYALLLGFVFMTAHLACVPMRMLLRGLRPLRFILILTFLLNLCFNTGEKVLLSFWIIRITQEGLTQAIFFSMRLVFLVMGTSLLTLTTSPVSLSDAMEILMSPLKVIHFPAHELAMMMTIALRFIPTLLEETDKIRKAQMARGADFESGNLISRAKAMVPLLVPLFVSAFRRAGDLAMAMESRCYHGGEGRTRLRVLKLTKLDGRACAVMVAVLVLMILDGIFLGGVLP